MRIVTRIVLALVLVGGGWISGRAQTSQPTFEIVVNAPKGETSIECVRGCDLAWVERGVNPNAARVPTFTFSCTDSRCSSFKVGGWVKP